MFGLRKQKPLLDEASTRWLFDAYAWSLRNFNADVFYNESILVIPTDAYFPGRQDSVSGMAHLIFNKVKEYAFVAHWPCQLLDPNSPEPEPTSVNIQGALRGKYEITHQSIENVAKLIIPYNPHQISKPEALIADFAHIVAHYLGTMGKEPPPGGTENWPFATEILAIFMGFGLMFANSAYTYRGGCGSCYNPLSERTAFLSQDEVTYALAIFCVLKDIPHRNVTPYLKRYLRPLFRKSVKEIQTKKSELDALFSFRNQHATELQSLNSEN